MKKFLNFSTILFSYLLITVLVISCGGSSGGGGTGSSSVGDATDGSGGNGGDATDGTDGGGNGGDATDSTGGGVLPQPEPKDTNCLLPDRADKDSLVAVLCFEGVVMAKINKTEDPPAQIFAKLSSIESKDGKTSRTWDLITAKKIQISYDKDYTLKGDEYIDSSIVNISDAAGHTAEFPLKNLNIHSFTNGNQKELISSLYIHFSNSTSRYSTTISLQLGVETQDDFISMANAVVPVYSSGNTLRFGSGGLVLSYMLKNDLDLIASGAPDAKFNESIIPVAEAEFEFDGGGYTIILDSAIDAVANDKPAAIIGKVTKGMSFKNVIFNINGPISGRGNVGTIVGHNEAGAYIRLVDMKVNINRNITLYKSADNEDGYLGGLVGSGDIDGLGVVVKTGEGAVIQTFAQNSTETSFSPAVGGLFGKVDGGDDQFNYFSDNLVDVKLRVETSGDGSVNNSVSVGGLAGVTYNKLEINGNLVKLAISRDEKLTADFVFNEVAGLSANSDSVASVRNNLVYADFSNLGKVNVLGGLLGKMKSDSADISNNMLFIADGFTGSDVQENFGVAIANLVSGSSVAKITNNFVSSSVTDYGTNEKLASLLHTSEVDISFYNLIVDNKTDTFMFKKGFYANSLRGKVAADKIFTLAEAKTNEVSAILDPSIWEKVSGDYPQLKLPMSYLLFSLTRPEFEQYWTDINKDIQTKLAARASQ